MAVIWRLIVVNACVCGCAERLDAEQKRLYAENLDVFAQLPGGCEGTTSLIECVDVSVCVVIGIQTKVHLLSVCVCVSS